MVRLQEVVLLAAITVNLQLGYCLNTGTHGVYRLPDERKQNIRNNSDFILGQSFAMDVALLFTEISFLFLFFYEILSPFVFVNCLVKIINYLYIRMIPIPSCRLSPFSFCLFANPMLHRSNYVLSRTCIPYKITHIIPTAIPREHHRQ